MTSLQRKALILLIVVFLLVILNMVFGHVEKTFNMPSSNKVIVIDAGHGGRDAGASGKEGVKEKEVNLEIAKKLKRLIEDSGGVAIMIREEDNGLYSIDSPNKKKEDMKNRKQIIKDSNADLFISIHLNSFPQAKYYGAQVFYFEGAKTSQRLAQIMQQELRRILDRNNDRVEKSTKTYYILKENNVPSILVECGFLSNAEEEKLLGQNDYQEKIAWSLFVGILRFFSEPVAGSMKGD